MKQQQQSQPSETTEAENPRELSAASVVFLTEDEKKQQEEEFRPHREESDPIAVLKAHVPASSAPELSSPRSPHR